MSSNDQLRFDISSASSLSACFGMVRLHFFSELTRHEEAERRARHEEEEKVGEHQTFVAEVCSVHLFPPFAKNPPRIVRERAERMVIIVSQFVGEREEMLCFKATIKTRAAQTRVTPA